MPGPATSRDGSTNPPRISSDRAILNSGRAYVSVPVSTMFIVSRPQPSAMNHSSAAAITSAAVLPGAYASCQISKPRWLIRTESRTDSSSAVALDGAGMIELDVEGDEIEAVERLVVAHGHDVVEAVDADPLPAGSARVIGDVLARAGVEDLLERRRAVLADVPCLRRKDDERVAVGRQDDVRVPVHDLEPRHVRHGALEPAVLAAGDDQGVEPVLSHCCTDVGVASLELGC